MEIKHQELKRIRQCLRDYTSEMAHWARLRESMLICEFVKHVDLEC